MATGAARRARRRAVETQAEQVARINRLRAMADKDTPREGVNHSTRGAGKPQHFAKRGAEKIAAHGRVGGDTIYSWMRCSDLPRGRA